MGFCQGFHDAAVSCALVPIATGKEGSRGMRGVGRRGLTVDCRAVDFSRWRDLIISCTKCICKGDAIVGQHVFLPSN